MMHATSCSFYFMLFSRAGTNVTVRIPVPKATVSASHEPVGPGQACELRQTDKTYVWKIKKIEGGKEQVLILKVRGRSGRVIVAIYPI